jgi:hypothetical protein
VEKETRADPGWNRRGPGLVSHQARGVDERPGGGGFLATQDHVGCRLLSASMTLVTFWVASTGRRRRIPPSASGAA